MANVSTALYWLRNAFTLVELTDIWSNHPKNTPSCRFRRQMMERSDYLRVFSYLPYGLIVLGAMFSPANPLNATNPEQSEYRLRLFHTHTGKQLNVVYRRGNTYDPSALDQLNEYLRDHRTGDLHQYDPRVFDLLHDLSVKLGHPNAEINVICGYRSSWSNEFLRAHGHGVARHSLHMQAMAIDIRIPAVQTLAVRDAALDMRRGGVGYYPKSDFVHVDVGRVRRW
jgi:uncharacterized protein YcbK (DUF882 family)